jgi:replicative DNA helicase
LSASGRWGRAKVELGEGAGNGIAGVANGATDEGNGVAGAGNGHANEPFEHPYADAPVPAPWGVPAPMPPMGWPQPDQTAAPAPWDLPDSGPAPAGQPMPAAPSFEGAPDFAAPDYGAQPTMGAPVGDGVQPEFYGAPEWVVDSHGWKIQPRSALDVLNDLSDKVSRGEVGEYQPVPLGLTPLDKTLGGGIRAGELLLIGGAQGTGKTTLALQIARNIALGGQASVLYICFEHDEEYLLSRLIAMESALDGMPQTTGGMKIQDVRREILATWMAQGATEAADLAGNPRLRPALDRITRYGQNLYLMRGMQTTSTVENIRELVNAYRRLAPDRQLVVFVDYLQKVPMIPDAANETERVTVVVNGLKDVALTQSVAMVSIVAADKEGLKAARLRNHHLRGSSAINYEADIILIMNEKYSIVAKVNIEFNPYQAQRFRDWIIVTVEKNRAGQNSIDLEFEKHFEFSCFDPTGRAVQEKLIEERLFND